METEVNDEYMPTSSEQKIAKKNRQRSSIGSELMASFFKESELERITTPEHVIRRNRRSAAVRADHRNKILSKNSQRLSIDVGEQPSMKSCLTQKSTSQRAAEKLLKKYRRSRSFSHTPHRPSLRFNSICTVRVITPRPQYDPDNLCLPSDDEDSKRSDRERLSTVKLDMTPQSLAYIGLSAPTLLCHRKKSNSRIFAERISRKYKEKMSSRSKSQDPICKKKYECVPHNHESILPITITIEKAPVMEEKAEKFLDEMVDECTVYVLDKLASSEEFDRKIAQATLADEPMQYGVIGTIVLGFPKFESTVILTPEEEKEELLERLNYVKDSYGEVIMMVLTSNNLLTDAIERLKHPQIDYRHLRTPADVAYELDVILQYDD